MYIDFDAKVYGEQKIPIMGTFHSQHGNVLFPLWELPVHINGFSRSI